MNLDAERVIVKQMWRSCSCQVECSAVHSSLQLVIRFAVFVVSYYEKEGAHTAVCDF